MYLHFYCCRILLLEQCFTCAFMHHPLDLFLRYLAEEANLQRCVQNAALNLSPKCLGENLGSGPSFSSLTHILY